MLADSVEGDSSEFRAELRRLKLEFFVQVTGSSHKGWTCRVPAERKFKRRYVPASAPASQTLAQTVADRPDAAWQHCSWKAADGKTRRTRVTWIEVYLAHGLREVDGELEKVWLVVDWAQGEEHPYHYYLAELKGHRTKGWRPQAVLTICHPAPKPLKRLGVRSTAHSTGLAVMPFGNSNLVRHAQFIRWNWPPAGRCGRHARNFADP